MEKKNKRWPYVVGMIAVIILVSVFWARSRPEAVEYSSVVVERGTLLQTVAETGSVVAGSEITYGWQMSGRVTDVFKKVGDDIVKGDVIASLDSLQQDAAFREAQAGLAAARARLNLEIAGVSNDEIRESLARVSQQEAAVAQSEADFRKAEVTAAKNISAAEQALASAENDVRTIDSAFESELIKDAYDDLRATLTATQSKLDRALVEADNILGVDNEAANDAFQNDLSLNDLNAKINAENQYKLARRTLITFSSANRVLSAASSESDIDDVAVLAELTIMEVQRALLDTQVMLENTLATTGLTPATLDGLRSDVSTQQTTIDAQKTTLVNSVQGVSNARNSLSSARISLEKALSDLGNTRIQAKADIAVAQARLDAERARLGQVQAAHDALVAPPREVDLAALRAEVARASAGVERARDELDRTKLIALADGVLAALDIEIGENVTAQQEVVKVISKTLFVDVDISESDIAKVHINDHVKITLDAFTEDMIFEGHVERIDPAETEISGVIYYNADIAFDVTAEQQIRTGMTANITIFTDERLDTVIVPQRAILQDGDRTYVRILVDEKLGTYEERDVVTGLRGDDGQTQILSGVQEGEEIVTFVKEKE